MYAKFNEGTDFPQAYVHFISAKKCSFTRKMLFSISQKKNIMKIVFQYDIASYYTKFCLFAVGKKLMHSRFLKF